jgi:hypothetical protein
MYFMMLGTLGVYWVVMSSFVPVSAHLDPLAGSLLSALAALPAIAFFYIRFVRIKGLLSPSPARDALRIARLRQSWIVCFALCDAVGLCGFALYFMGGSKARSATFFLAAVALFLLSYPRLPEMPDEEEERRN